MKTIFSTLAISLLLMQNGYAQSFAAITLPKDQTVSPLAMNFPSSHRDYHPGPVCIVGGIALPVGCVLVLFGLFEQMEASAQEANSYSPVPTAESEGRGGRAMVAIGAIMAPVGLGMVIGGSIHNHRMRKHSLGLIVPRRNQVGLAYNF